MSTLSYVMGVLHVRTIGDAFWLAAWLAGVMYVTFVLGRMSGAAGGGFDAFCGFFYGMLCLAFLCAERSLFHTAFPVSAVAIAVGYTYGYQTMRIAVRRIKGPISYAWELVDTTNGTPADEAPCGLPVIYNSAYRSENETRN